MTKDLRAAKNFTNRLDGHMDDQLDTGDAESSLTIPVKVSALRVNGYVLINDNPCRIVNIQTSRPGKHGHAKAHLVGIDVITGKKCDVMAPSHHTLPVPIVTKTTYIVVDVGRDGFVCLLDDAGHTKRDVRAVDDMLTSLTEKVAAAGDEDVLATVLKVMDKELIMAVKTGFK